MFLLSAIDSATLTLILIIAGGVIGMLVGVALTLSRRNNTKKAETAAKQKADAEAKAEVERKRVEEKAAAREFNERRSVDTKSIEENRRVAGASSVTGKDNIVK